MRKIKYWIIKGKRATLKRLVKLDIGEDTETEYIYNLNSGGIKYVLQNDELITDDEREELLNYKSGGIRNESYKYFRSY
ncbi:MULTISPECIES: hypothetical protein [unclassified Clostridium]|uniref:hypothetical protein n=1 Tax=unclassified Clostridium TaxID=2614128 RepID=UPI0025C0A6AF|nr:MULTISPECIES: hypothetical protein [unclassified Clostridium]